MSVGVHSDVLIVGAGPAGSSAARHLADRGVSVLLVDREQFPRYKTCGGGIIGVTHSCIPPGAPLRDEIYRASFSLRGRALRTRESTSPVMATVSREEFDQWLLEQAISAGAHFQPLTTVRSVQAAMDSVVVSTRDHGQLTARYLIDASGTSSRIARQVGVELQAIDLGLELELEALDDRTWRQQIHLDWGAIPGSYGWLFPKADSLTVGVIAPKERSQDLHSYLSSFVRQLGLEGRRVLKNSGHLTRSRAPASPLSGDRVLLAGDAAGLLEPWTREGISFAVRSGIAAAEVLEQAVRRRVSANAIGHLYRKQLEQSILSEIDAGFEALAAFKRHPEIFHALMAYTPFGWRYFTRITTGDTNLQRAMAHASVRVAISALQRL